MKKLRIRIILALLLVTLLPQSVMAARLLVPGGEVIGLELGDSTVTIAAFDPDLGEAAQAAGLKIGDRITHINGKTIQAAADIRQALLCSDGSVSMEITRSGRQQELKVQPAITADGPRLGIYLKQGITGIGTVTWYDPDTGIFGALGHGVNDASGKLLQMQQGTAYAASVISVRKGQVGTPGQLLGSLNGHMPLGTLQKNTNQGVFGKAAAGWDGSKLPAATAAETRTGQATILSTVSNGTVQEYSVEILKVYPNQRAGGRNMLIKVTDPRLLAATGGIVQGMGLRYNRDNPEKILACSAFLGWFLFSSNCENSRISCADMPGRNHFPPLITAENEICERSLFQGITASSAFHIPAPQEKYRTASVVPFGIFVKKAKTLSIKEGAYHSWRRSGLSILASGIANTLQAISSSAYPSGGIRTSSSGNGERIITKALR